MAQGGLPDWIEDEPEHLRSVLVELTLVRSRGVWGLRTSNAAIPSLLATARLLCPNVSQLSHYELVKALFESWILPRLSNSDASACLIYFGLANEQRTTSSSDRRKEVAKAFLQGSTYFRDPVIGLERPFLVRLAQLIVALPEEAERLRASDENHATALPYVVRSVLEQEFADALAIGARLVSFEGAPGMGKTTLADHCTRSTRRIWIDASTSESFDGSLMRELGDRRELGVAGDAVERRRTLIRLLRSPQAPQFLVLDNLSDTEMVSELIDVPSSTVLLWTARRFLSGLPGSTRIVVDLLKPEEAQEIIRRLLPSATHEQTTKLADASGKHPLAIVHACGLICEEDGFTIESLCEAIRHYTTHIFESNDEDAGRASLTQVYRNTLTTLEEKTPHAARLLEILSFFIEGEVSIAKEFLVRCLASVLGISPLSGELAHAIANRALKALERRYLVTVDVSGIPPSYTFLEAYVDAHQLTRLIVNGLIDRHHASDLRRKILLAAEQFANKYKERAYLPMRHTLLSTLPAMIGAPSNGTLADFDQAWHEIATTISKIQRMDDPRTTPRERARLDRVSEIQRVVNSVSGRRYRRSTVSHDEWMLWINSQVTLTEILDQEVLAEVTASGLLTEQELTTYLHDLHRAVWQGLDNE